MLIALLVCTPCSFVALHKFDLPLLCTPSCKFAISWGVVSLSIYSNKNGGTYQSWLPDGCGVFKCSAVFRA